VGNHSEAALGACRRRVIDFSRSKVGMVVEYATANTGSALSFFIVTPQILFKWTGSVVPSIFPQVLMAVGIAVLSRYWNPVDNSDIDLSQAMTIMSFLLSFLLVFKTQTAYNQFWHGLGHAESLMRLSRHVAVNACTLLPWEEDDNKSDGATDSQSTPEQPKPQVRFFARKVIRLIVLHCFVVIEHFMRTGANQTRSKRVKDRLREDIRLLTGPNEYHLLYTEVYEEQISGSESDTPSANPLVVLYWIELAISRCGRAHKVPPNIIRHFALQTNELGDHFWEMNKIDKNQFPLPYAQVVKFLVTFFIFILPFMLRPKCNDLTEIMIAVIAMGFFGLDEVAEILESPFGCDPNDIDLASYGRDLMLDLEIVYHGRNQQLDTVFSDEVELSFQHMLRQGGSAKSDKKRDNLLRRHSDYLRSFTGTQLGDDYWATAADLPNVPSVKPAAHVIKAVNALSNLPTERSQ